MTQVTKTPFKISARDLVDGNANRIIHKYSAPAHVTVEQLLDPYAWSVHSYRFNIHDLIEVVWQDNSKECMLRVLDAQKDMARVALRGPVIEYEKQDALESDNSQYAIKFAGPQRKHAIIRKDTNEIIEDRIATKMQAEERIQQLMKTFG